MKLTILCVTFLFIGLTIAEIPSYIPICGRRNPQLQQCIRDAFETVYPKLKAGIPELDIPTINPLYIKNALPFVWSPGLKTSASNVKIYNLDSAQIQKLNFDLENKKLNVDLYFSQIKFTGDYEVSAKIIVPIETKGNMSMDIEGVTAQAALNFKFLNTKKGQIFFFDTMTVKLKVKDYKLHFVSRDGTTNDKTFDEAINNVLNTNRREITDSFLPNVEKVISMNVLENANKIAKHFPYDEVLPDRE